MTPLHLACWAGKADTAKLLLSHGASVHNVEGQWQCTPIHFAATHEGSFEEESTISMLLTHGANLDKLNSSGMTPELVALQGGNKNVVQIIREHREKIGMLMPVETSKLEDDIRVKMSERLLSAVENGDMEMCKYLVERGIEIDRPRKCRSLVKRSIETDSQTERSGCTSFIFSCAVGNFDISIFFLQNGANCDRVACDFESTKAYTAVHYAACHGDLTVLKAFLRKLTSCLDFGVKPFHLAAANGHLECLKFLLDYEKSTKNLHNCINLGIKGGSDLDHGLVSIWRLPAIVPVPLGTTALHLASHENKVDVVAFLLKEGAQTGQADEKGQTALHVTAKAGHTDIIDILLENGAYLEKADARGRTPLYAAVKGRQMAAAARLLLAGGNVNCRDNRGNTLLHKAIRYSSKDIIELLQEYGIDVAVKNVEGQQAIREAIYLDETAIFESLLLKKTDLLGCDIKGLLLL